MQTTHSYIFNLGLFSECGPSKVALCQTLMILRFEMIPYANRIAESPGSFPNKQVVDA